MKSRGEREAAICEAVSRFEQDYMGRGPKDIHTYLLGDPSDASSSGNQREAQIARLLRLIGAKAKTQSLLLRLHEFRKLWGHFRFIRLKRASGFARGFSRHKSGVQWYLCTIRHGRYTGAAWRNGVRLRGDAT